jgi:hypothetical protein
VTDLVPEVTYDRPVRLPQTPNAALAQKRSFLSADFAARQASPSGSSAHIANVSGGTPSRWPHRSQKTLSKKSF